jgi:hypothetical protein
MEIDIMKDGDSDNAIVVHNTLPIPEDDMADIYLPTLHDGQLKVWSDSWDGQLHAVRCGRRWGKPSCCPAPR